MVVNIDASDHDGGVVALQVTISIDGSLMNASLPMVVTALPMVTLDRLAQL